MAMRSFEQLKYEATWMGPKRVGVVAAANAETLAAAQEAQSLGMAQCILADARAKLEQLAQQHNLNLAGMTILDLPDHQEAAAAIMRMAHAGEVDVVVKGAIETATFLRVALDRDNGLRTGRLFTHVALFEIPGFERLLYLSDAGVVVSPDIYQKMEIVQNAIDVALKLGVEQPKVAILAAQELVDPKAPTTMDAANLSKMAERGQIRGGLVDGPLGLDNAISLNAARVKRIESPVAGQADILIVPDVESGNLLAKAIMYFGHAEMAGVVVGGCVLCVVTSRADSHITKLVSIALGVVLTGTGCGTVRILGA
jgi:phosphate butyryltransferase